MFEIQKKRGCAVLLALAMMSVSPLTALAEESENMDPSLFVQQEEEVTASVDAVNSGETGGSFERILTALEEEHGEEEAAAEPVVQQTVQKTGNATVDLLNSATLHPREPGSQALAGLLDDIMDEIIQDDMNTYEQLRASYDYLLRNVSYGSPMSRMGTVVADGVTCNSIYSSYGEVEGFGAVALTSGTGLCNAYASAFILMAQRIGLDISLVKGSTRSAGGGYAYHEWAEARIGDQIYVFDPQLDQDLTARGLPAYSVFAKTYDQLGGRYSK